MNTLEIPANIKCPAAAAASFPKTEHKVKKLVRRVIETVKPTHCRIRYDSMANKWAVLDKKNEPHHHFDFGVMTNVTFRVERLKGYDPLRCTQINENIGIAEGDLRENYIGFDGGGFNHMGFDKEKGFVDAHGSSIAKAQTLRLMKDRSALYK